MTNGSEESVGHYPVLTTASKARELMGGAEGEAGITPPTGGRPPPTPDSVQLKGWKNGTQCCTSETRPQFSKTDLSQWNHSLQTMDFFQRGHLSCRWAPTPRPSIIMQVKVHELFMIQTVSKYTLITMNQNHSLPGLLISSLAAGVRVCVHMQSPGILLYTFQPVLMMGWAE